MAGTERILPGEEETSVGKREKRSAGNENLGGRRPAGTRERLAAGLFSVAFCLILAGVALLTLTRPAETVSVWENRSLAEFPEVKKESLADGSWFRDMEEFLCDHAALRATSLRMLTRTDLNLFHRPVVNEIVPTEEALLPWWDYEETDPEEMERLAEEMGDRLALVQAETERYGGLFLYVAVPSQNAFWGDYPSFLNSRVEYAELSRDCLARALEKRGIGFLDAGQLWAEQGNPPEYFSRGDHHWTLSGCLSVTEEILAELNRRTGSELALPELIRETLPNPVLGSRSRYLCGLVDTGEHLSWARPAEPIPFTRQDNGQEREASLFAFPASESEDVAYTFYMGGDVARTDLRTERPQLPSCLLFGDSFTNLMETFLWTAFDETGSVDLRMDPELSLLEQIRTEQPEVVLCVRDYVNLLTQSGNGEIR